MKAHDVRNLRYCETCEELGHKDDFLRDDLCIPCAYKAAGGLDGFMAQYGPAEWDKLPLSLIGADAMRKLLDAIEGRAAITKATGGRDGQV